MGFEFRAKKLLGGSNDDPLAGTAEAESHGRGPRPACWHPIVPPSSAVVAAGRPARATGGPGRQVCVGALAWPARGGAPPPDAGPPARPRAFPHAAPSPL